MLPSFLQQLVKNLDFLFLNYSCFFVFINPSFYTFMMKLTLVNPNSTSSKFSDYQKIVKTGKVGYLILAGNMADVRHRLEPVVRTLVNLVFHYHLFIIPVMNVEVTIAYAIHRILTDVDAKKNLSINIFPNKPHLPSGKKIISLDMLQSIPGIGSRGASEILHSKYSTIDKLLEATPSDIALIPKIGIIKAISIYNAIRRTDSL